MHRAADHRYLDYQCGVQRRALRPLEGRQSRSALRNAVDVLLNRRKSAQSVLFGLPAVPAGTCGNATVALRACRTVLHGIDATGRTPCQSRFYLASAMLTDDRPDLVRTRPAGRS